MFNSTILDVAIGVTFVYLLLSLMCSAANEIIELWLKNRAADLERGIRELLNDRDRKSGLVEKIYSHPLVSSLFEKSYDPQLLTRLNRFLGRVNLPSYIPARNFALALMDTRFSSDEGNREASKPDEKILADQGTTSGVTGATPASSPSAQVVVNVVPPPPAPPPNPNALRALRENIQSIPNESVKEALTAVVNAAGNDPARVRENIEDWYNSSMDRVSGWYKRRAQVSILIIAFFVAVAVNADSIVIAKRLWSDKSLRESLVAAADAYAKANAAVSPSPTPAPVTAASTATTKPNQGTTATTAPTSTPTPTPTRCWEQACPKGIEPSEECRLKMIQCEREACWRAACPTGQEDTPQCKLKKSQCEINELGLPIGWNSVEWPGLHFWQPKRFVTRWYPPFRVHLLGWLLTVLAISVGAPFWFDLLNKFIVVRSTVKPKEKSSEEKSKD